MRSLLTLVCLASWAVVFAQDPADIFHKTVDLDSINEVTLDVYTDDRFEVKQWPGDDILIETSVKLVGGKPFILKFFKEQERYDLTGEVSGDVLALVSKDMVRRKVNGTDGQTIENVNIVLYMPDTFAPEGDNRYRRQSK